MEYLEVKNFGPIKHAKVELKKFNVFIGETSSGKSTMAKLVSAIYDRDFTGEHNLGNVEKIIDKYGILGYLNRDSEINCEAKDFSFHFTNGVWHLNYSKMSNLHFRETIKTISNALDQFVRNETTFDHAKAFLLQYIKVQSIYEEAIDFFIALEAILKDKKLKTLYDLNQAWSILANEYRYVELFPSIYIPAERMVISMVAESLFGLMNNDVTIAKCVKDFGAHFEVARKKVPAVDFQWLGASYEYQHKSNFVKQNEQSFMLEESSSGFQSIIPTLVVLEHYASQTNKENNLFVIEEPELNLYPSMQKKFVEHIVEKLQQTEDKIILTTHSPYVLTSLDNLIQAHQASLAQPDKKSAVQALVPENYWVNYDDVACYYFKDGTCVSTLDTENKSIGPSNIDDVSEALGQVFEQLLDIKYS